MGWFLKSGKKSPRSSAKKAPKPAEGDRKKHLWAAARLVGALALLAGGVFGWRYLEPVLVAEIRRQAVPALRVELVDVPPVIRDSGLEAQLLQQAVPLLRSDRFDYQGLRDVATILRANPWVEHLESVKRCRDGRVEIRARYRVPVALVKHGGVYHLIDATGVRLPTHPSRALWNQATLMIEGLAQPAPAEGRIWEGEDLAAALRLATLIDGQDWADQVRAIDATNHGGRRSRAEAQLVIRTLRDGQILWGRAPGEEGVFEPHAAFKLQHLTQVRHTFSGAVDGGGAGWKVAVFGDNLEILRPDTARSAEALYSR